MKKTLAISIAVMFSLFGFSTSASGADPCPSVTCLPPAPPQDPCALPACTMPPAPTQPPCTLPACTMPPYGDTSAVSADRLRVIKEQRAVIRHQRHIIRHQRAVIRHLRANQ